MLQVSSVSRITALVLLGMSTAGCEVVGGIFKAGFWVGVIAVVAVLALVGFGVSKMKG